MSIQNPLVKPSDRMVLLGIVDPDAYAAGSSYSTGWVSMATVESLVAWVLCGDFVATGKLDAKLEQASDGSGTGVKDISGKAITQLTQAGTDDNKQAVINLRSSELDTANNFTHARLTLTVTTAGVDAAGLLFGLDHRYTPAHASTVDEVVG